MPRKQITQFTAASSIAPTDRFLLQQGATGTAFTHGTVTQLLNGSLAATFSTIAGTTGTFSSTATATAFIPTSATIPSNGMYLPAANTLGFAINSAADMKLTASALFPAVSDGLALGTSALMWSDAFFASGAVLNFANGDVTLTHSVDTLTLAGGTLAVSALTATTGVFSSSATATAFIPTSATLPTNGMYLPATNSLAWATNTTEGMRLNSTGDLGVGTTAPMSRLHVTKTQTSASGSTINLRVGGSQAVASTGTFYTAQVSGAYTASSGNTLAALIGLLVDPTNADTGAITTLYGIRSGPQNLSTGTVASLYGATSIPTNSGAGTVTNAYGILARVDNTNVGGTITSAYGVFIGTSVNAGTVVNNWGLYQENAGAKNAFFGRTLIGSATDDASTNLQVNGTFKVTGASTLAALSATTGAFTGVTTVNLSGTAISAVAGFVFGAAAADGLNTGVVLDAVAVYPRYILRRANGTSASRTAVVLGDTLGALEGRGYDGSAFTASHAGIDFAAAENWSGAARGGKIAFRTTTNGATTTATVKMTLENSGALLIGGTTDDGTNKLRVSGGVTVDTGNSYKVNDVAVVGVRKTGWAAATGTATRTTFATTTVTTEQLAQRVKALIDDLISHGLIGA